MNHIHIQYTYIVGKYKKKNVRALETGRRASLRRAFHACFAASTNELYILRQCTYFVFILQCQKSRKACQI